MQILQILAKYNLMYIEIQKIKKGIQLVNLYLFSRESSQWYYSLDPIKFSYPAYNNKMTFILK